MVLFGTKIDSLGKSRQVVLFEIKIDSLGGTALTHSHIRLEMYV